jgi:putative ABC transport system permease protein
VISISGLMIGMTTTFLLALYLINELSYDRHHKNAAKIFRIINENTVHHFKECNSPFLMPPAAKENIPGIEDYCRTFSMDGSQVKKGEEWIPAEGIYSADKQVFSIFSFKFLSGGFKNKMDPGDIFISNSFAGKFLQAKELLGKIVSLNLKGKMIEFTIRGVYADYPINSVFRPEAIISMETGHSLLTRYLTIIGDSSYINNFTDDWKGDFFSNYLLLQEGADHMHIASELDSLSKKHLGNDKENRYYLQKLTDAYLHSDEIVAGNEPHGSFSNVLIFLLVSVLILLASGMNYVLLFTSRALASLKEFGIRRIMGAGKYSIFSQLTLEAIYTCLLALPLAIMFTELLLPEENRILKTSIHIQYLSNSWYLLVIFLIPILLGLLSGLFVFYQAYNQSSLEVMKNSMRWKSGLSAKKILIVFQLVIFIGLISTILIIKGQVRLLIKHDPGFETSNLFIVPFPDEAFANKYNTFKTELESLPFVTNVSATWFNPPSANIMGMQFKAPSLPSGKMIMEFLMVDYNYVETMGMKLIAGRSFSREYPSDPRSVIITESAAKELNLKNPVGTKLPFGEVIGVIKDIQLHSLVQQNKPAFLRLNPGSLREMVVRIKPLFIKEFIEVIHKKMTAITGKNDFKYSLYTDKISELYKSEIRLNTIISIFSFVAFMLACLGLFGLASIMTEQRTKEIGIRKVNGAHTAELMIMLGWDILKWVCISAVLAVLPVIYLMNKWLEHYVYHQSISAWIFIFSTLFALLVAILTTIWHGYRCASKNPVEALKYE